MRILIAEDDENLREGIAFSLSLDGFEIATASGVKETLERLKKEPVDSLTEVDLKCAERCAIFAMFRF